MKTYHSFKNIETFQKWLRTKEWGSGEIDYITLGGHVYTMHEYDSEGKYIQWGNVKLKNMIQVETSNRYDKSNGFKDARVYLFDDWQNLRNDITYHE